MRLTASLSIFLLYTSVLSDRVGDDPDTTVRSTTTLHSTVTIDHYNGPTSRPWASPLAGGVPKWHWRGSHGFGSSNHAVGVGRHDGGNDDDDGEHQVAEIQDLEENTPTKTWPMNQDDLPTTTFVRSTVYTTTTGTKTVPFSSHIPVDLFRRTPHCQAGYNICKDKQSCCPDGTYCGTDVSGKYGCCAVGATCTGLVGNPGSVSVWLTSTAQPVSNAARSNHRPAPFFGLLTSLVKVTVGASEPNVNCYSEGDEVANPAARADLVKRSGHVTRKYHHHHHNNTAISLRPHRMFSMLAPWLSVGTASRHMADPRTEHGGLKVKNREVADQETRQNGHRVGQNDDAVMGLVDVPCIKVERDIDANQSKNANEALGLGSALVSAWEKAKAIWS